MEFVLTEEQQQLQDSLRRYLDQKYSFESRRKQIQSNLKCAPEHWAAFAEFGILGLGIPEQCGGLGVEHNVGGSGNFAEDTMIVMSSFGRALVVEPYISTVVLCGAVLREHTAQAIAADLLGKIASGETPMALAAYERAGRYQLSYVQTQAKRDGDSFIINGSKSVVIHADVADTLIVSARTAGGVSDQAGISMFVVDKNAAGLHMRAYATNDGLSAADIRFENVRVNVDARIADEDAGYATLEKAIGYGIAALSAEALGAMEALCAQTLEYLKSRKQFGVAIGSFQALQHRMVDMYIATEQARSMTMLAALKVGSDDIHERRRVVAATKSLVGQSARYVGQQAVQLHGGMGVTDELAISHYYKRLTAIDMIYGDAYYQRGVLGDLLAA